MLIPKANFSHCTHLDGF